MTYDENLLNEQKQKIEGVYTKIGERYYAAHRRDRKAEFPDLFKEIKGYEKVMADHKAEVLRANGLMICPRCGEQIYYKSVYCNFCGIKLDEYVAEEDEYDPEEPAEEPVVEEPVAEEPVVEEPVAEEPVVEEPVAEEPVAEEPVAEEPAVEEPAVEEPAAEEPAPGKVCRNCGATLPEGCAFCIECGHPADDDSEAPAPEKTAPADEVRFCKECGYRAEPDALFCNNCGARLGDDAAEEAPQEKKCPFCGFTTTDPEVLFCIECGTKLA